MNERMSDTALLELEALKSLPPDLVLMKMENEHIMSVASAQPIDYQKVKQDLIGMIDAFPEAAEKAIYSKPVGSVYLIQCQCGHSYEAASYDENSPCSRCEKFDPKGKPRRVKKFARGLSIRSAENVRVAIGFNRVACTINPIDGDRYKLTHSFVDYRTGNVTQIDTISSPFYTTRTKQRQRMSDDRFFNVTLKGDVSRGQREVVLRSVPGTIKAFYEDYCEKKIKTLLTDERVKQIIETFATKGVTLRMLETEIGRPLSMGWTTEDRQLLIGLWSALEDGETTVAEIFGEANGNSEAEQKTRKTKRPKGAVTAEALAGQEPETEQPQEESEAEQGSETEKPEKTAAPLQYRCLNKRCGVTFLATEVKDGKCPNCLRKEIEAA